MLNVRRGGHHYYRNNLRPLKNYQRVKTAYEYNPDINYVHTVTGISKHVVKEYVKIINHIVFT